MNQQQELIQYFVFKSSGLSASAARKQLGLEDMLRKSEQIYKSLEEAQEIREAIDKLREVRDETLHAMGVSDTVTCSSESDQEDETDTFAPHEEKRGTC